MDEWEKLDLEGKQTEFLLRISYHFSTCAVSLVENSTCGHV